MKISIDENSYLRRFKNMMEAGNKSEVKYSKSPNLRDKKLFKIRKFAKTSRTRNKE